MPLPFFATRPSFVAVQAQDCVPRPRPNLIALSPFFIFPPAFSTLSSLSPSSPSPQPTMFAKISSAFHAKMDGPSDSGTLTLSMADWPRGDSEELIPYLIAPPGTGHSTVPLHHSPLNPAHTNEDDHSIATVTEGAAHEARGRTVGTSSGRGESFSTLLLASWAGLGWAGPHAIASVGVQRLHCARSHIVPSVRPFVRIDSTWTP